MTLRSRSAGGTRRSLLSGYTTQPRVPDELLAADGTVRPVWKPFLDALAASDPAGLLDRMARGDSYLRDAGVYYRQYGEAEAERDWPLSHIPVLLAEAEWSTIADGLIQRAELLETICADLYGRNSLVSGGHLPAELIGSNKEWLRPLVGITPRGGHFLNFIAFEIGRGPDGEWWVLGDRTQAPSGAGFALETRMATSRVFADFLASANVHRLAGFFRDFRDALNAQRGDPLSRVAILTPGQHNETYFEHAYIARYLGFALLEGEDLVVEDGALKVRTVAGLFPVDVLWRRLDAGFADPLELNERSHLGTPGLVSAIRQGAVTMINALGSGVLETRALLAFLPRLCHQLRGEPLKMPNIATWWCGQPNERAYVREFADQMVVGDALSTALPFASEKGAMPTDILGPARSSLREMIDHDGARLVGQEMVTLSTTPALVDGVLRPRPMILRMFLARTARGWQVMPGGYARIGRSTDAAAIAMRGGGSVADVWVVADHPVPRATLLSTGEGPFERAMLENLPSRAADNLYWLGRYVERVEGDVRLLRSYHLRLSESPSADNPLLASIEALLEERGMDPAQTIPSGLLATIDSAIFSASKIRDRFSVDGWLALNDLAKTMRKFHSTVTPGDDAARAMSVLLRKISGFTGLVHENMYRFTGWRFLSIGRAIERAGYMAMTLQLFATEEPVPGALDLAVEIGDSAISHRRRYAVTTSRITVVDLLALDSMNPRAILFALNELHTHIGFLPDASVHGQLSALARAALALETSIAVLTPEDITVASLREFTQRLWALSDLLTRAYFR